MPAFWKILLLAVFACITVAQTTVVDFLMIGEDYFDSVGSVIKIESSITTVHIGCAPSTKWSTCHIDSGKSATLVQGLSTYQFVQEGTRTRQCDLSPAKETYSCNFTETYKFGVISTSTIIGKDYTELLYAVTVTAGVNKLPTGLSRKSDDQVDHKKTLTSSSTDNALTTTSALEGPPTTQTLSSTISKASARPVVTQNVVLAGIGLAAAAIIL